MKFTNEIVVRAATEQGQLIATWDIMQQRVQLLLDDGDGPIFSFNGNKDTLNKLHRALRGTPNIGEQTITTPLTDDKDTSAVVEETKNGFRIVMTTYGEYNEKSLSITKEEAKQLGMALRITFTLEGPSI